MSDGIDVSKHGRKATFSGADLVTWHPDDPFRDPDNTGAQNTRLAGRLDVDFYWNHPVNDGPIDTPVHSVLQAHGLKQQVTPP